MPAAASRVQFVISGPFLLLLILTTGFFTAGFWLYTHQPPPVRPPSPGYYVNRTLTAVRPCFSCVDPTGRLKPTPEWKIGKTAEIPAGELWWFAPVEDPAVPVKVEGVPVLAVHPAKDNTKPWEGFDQRKVVLVVFQDVDGRFAIDHPPPPPAPVPAPDASAAPVTTTPQQQP